MDIDDILRLADVVKQHAFTLTKNSEDAKDLAQQALYLALKYKDSCTHTNVRAWLLCIVNNVYINEKKSKFRLCRVLKDVEVQTTVQSSNAPYSVNLDKISEPLKMYVQGYTYEEIAAALGKTAGTIKYNINRERKRLAGMLR